MIKKRGKRSQIWVETVIYTLIGLTIIGILISVITPKITQMKDKAILSQTIESLNILNSKIVETLTAPGNSRQIMIGVNKGEYVINSTNDSIYFVLSGIAFAYSEPGEEIPNGEITVLTIPNQGKYDVFLMLRYPYNITYEDKETTKFLTPASNSYGLLVENKGSSDKKINIRLVS